MTRRRRGSARWTKSVLAPAVLLALGGCELSLLSDGAGDVAAAVEPDDPATVGQSEIASDELEDVTGTVPASAGAATEGLRETALGRASGPESGLDPPQSVLVTLPTTAAGGFAGTLPGPIGPTAPPPGPTLPPPTPPPVGGGVGGSFGSTPGAGAGTGAGFGAGFGSSTGSGLGSVPF